MARVRTAEAAEGRSLASGTALLGTVWRCSATTGAVPVAVELFAERSLRKRPSVTSPVVRLTVADPCQTTGAVARAAPNALLRFYGSSPYSDDERVVTVQHRSKAPARYWLRISQAGRVLGQLRYYVALRPRRGSPRCG